ncbi:hypothetical protein RQP46_002560 [Phenoliferia psychrophenolica]
MTPAWSKDSTSSRSDQQHPRRLTIQTGREFATDRSSSSESSSAGGSDSDEVTTPDEGEYDFDDDLFFRGREGSRAVRRATSGSVVVPECTKDSFALALPIQPSLGPLKTTPNLYPTFGDWLPEFTASGDSTVAVTRRMSEQDPAVVGAKDRNIGLGLTILDSKPVERPVVEAKPAADSDDGKPFATTTPFSPFESEDRTFIFFPSTSFHDSASNSPPLGQKATLHPDSAIYTPTTTHFPLTPPRSRSGTPLNPPTAHSKSTSLPSTPPVVLSLPLRPLPPPFVPARPIIAAPEPDDYPLSEADTAILASLHEGRIPSLQQLAPPLDAPENLSVQPIINTGNHGPMIIQNGDWKCGACTFVNWRRRKICMRCFPYANDIGNMITIQGGHTSHRPSTFAAPTPPTTHSHPTSFSTSQHAHATHPVFFHPHYPRAYPLSLSNGPNSHSHSHLAFPDSQHYFQQSPSSFNIPQRTPPRWAGPWNSSSDVNGIQIFPTALPRRGQGHGQQPIVYYPTNPYIDCISELKDQRNSGKALAILEALAAQFKPIMKAHMCRLTTLAEIPPAYTLKLDFCTDCSKPYGWILHAMCHELAHLEKMDHYAMFWSINADIKKELVTLRQKGYYGDGWFRVPKVAGGTWQGQKDPEPYDYVCATVHGLGPKSSSHVAGSQNGSSPSKKKALNVIVPFSGSGNVLSSASSSGSVGRKQSTSAAAAAAERRRRDTVVKKKKIDLIEISDDSDDGMDSRPKAAPKRARSDSMSGDSPAKKTKSTSSKPQPTPKVPAKKAAVVVVAAAAPNPNRRWRATSEEREEAEKKAQVKARRPPQQFFSTNSSAANAHAQLVKDRQANYPSRLAKKATPRDPSQPTLVRRPPKSPSSSSSSPAKSSKSKSSPTKKKKSKNSLSLIEDSDDDEEEEANSQSAVVVKKTASDAKSSSSKVVAAKVKAMAPQDEDDEELMFQTALKESYKTSGSSRGGSGSLDRDDASGSGARGR